MNAIKFYYLRICTINSPIVCSCCDLRPSVVFTQYVAYSIKLQVCTSPASAVVHMWDGGCYYKHRMSEEPYGNLAAVPHVHSLIPRLYWCVFTNTHTNHKTALERVFTSQTHNGTLIIIITISLHVHLEYRVLIHHACMALLHKVSLKGQVKLELDSCTVWMPAS